MRHLFATALLLSVALPAAAENLEVVQQLIATRQCQRCDLSNAGLVYAELAGANLMQANLVGANLNRANLTNANLTGANLTGAVLFNANLAGADLRNADLRGADLREARLTGARMEGALLDGANLFGATGIPTQVLSAEQLYVWGLTETQRGNFQGAIAYFNQSLNYKPDFAHAYLGRGIARYRLLDEAGALEDAARAGQLYQTQNNAQGQQLAQQFTEGVKLAQQRARESEERMRRGGGGGNFLNFLGSLTGLLLRFLF